MFVRAVCEALVDLGEDHNYFVLVNVGNRFVVDDSLIELCLSSVYASFTAKWG
jgi:hypothetical protein